MAARGVEKGRPGSGAALRAGHLYSEKPNSTLRHPPSLVCGHHTGDTACPGSRRPRRLSSKGPQGPLRVSYGHPPSEETSEYTTRHSDRPSVHVRALGTQKGCWRCANTGVWNRAPGQSGTPRGPPPRTARCGAHGTVTGRVSSSPLTRAEMLPRFVTVVPRMAFPPSSSPCPGPPG